MAKYTISMQRLRTISEEIFIEVEASNPRVALAMVHDPSGEELSSVAIAAMAAGATWAAYDTNTTRPQVARIDEVYPPGPLTLPPLRNCGSCRHWCSETKIRGVCSAIPDDDSRVRTTSANIDVSVTEDASPRGRLSTGKDFSCSLFEEIKRG